jgi:hypothetical protein
VGVLRRGETAQTLTARWNVAVPEIEEIIRKREQTREICTTLFDRGFASAAVKLLFREKMAEDAHEFLRRLENLKDFDQRYAKVIILRKTGDANRARGIINSTKEEKTIEEMELLGIELAKIDHASARALIEANLERYPKNMEILIAVANILEAMGDRKLGEIKTKIKKKMETAQYPRKIKNRAKLVLHGENAELDGILHQVRKEEKEKMWQKIAGLCEDEVGRTVRELEDCLKGHYFEIKDPKMANEIREAHAKLRERAIQIESKKVAIVLEILEKRENDGAALAIGEFEKIDWKFSERRGELARKIAKVAMKNDGNRVMRAVVAKMAIESKEKELFLEVIEVARKRGDGSSVAEKYDQAIRANLLNYKDASKEAKKIEETDFLLATRIRSQFEELIEELLNSLISRAHEIDTQTLKECISRVFEVEDIRKGRNSKKVAQLMEIYEKRRDPSQMN